MMYSAFLRESTSSRAMLHGIMSMSLKIGRNARTAARWIVGSRSRGFEFVDLQRSAVDER
jgi:hypothetical protein